MDLRKITVTNIRQALTVCSPKGRYEKMKERKCYGISLCIEGQITYVQDGKRYVSDKNTAIVLPKGGSYDIYGDRAGCFPVINFDCLDFLCDTITVIPIQNAEELISDYERLKKLFCFDGSRAKVFSIFYGILDKLSSDNIPYEIKNALRMIKGEYHDPDLTNERLARECNMSEVYFRKLFAKYFNISPKQYVIEIRLQKAKQLLAEGVSNISEISENCGFSNPYHFCRAFKQHTGITPSEYRKENLIDKI